MVNGSKHKALGVRRHQTPHPDPAPHERTLPPHPGSLPRGEGDSHPVSRRIGALPVCNSPDEVTPTPLGSGQG